MATVTALYSTTPRAPNAVVVTWTPITVANGDGSPEPLQHYPDKVVQVFGAFDSNTITMQGSNDGGTTWFTLTSPPANGSANAQNCTFTAAGGKAIIENPQFIRPLNSAGTTVSNTVAMACH